MREVNFSIPNANKASVGITTALYDRRALDCTSTLPLINSLNNLAYLTTSSGRIRDILTVDGGIERLVCILKEGRSKDMMEMWKWNLAFQCIVNIGVRGSEAVRTRVVEADMVPVIATILDNYFQVTDKNNRERAELESKRNKCPLGSFGGSRTSFSRSNGRSDSHHSQRSERSRRHAPPPIEIPEPRDQAEQDESTSDVTPIGQAANLSLSSPPERTSFIRHRAQRSHGTRAHFSTPGGSRQIPEPPASPAPVVPLPSNGGSFGLRPVRDVDRLPSMVPTLHAELSSQPQSPTTPGAPLARSGSPSASNLRRPRRPSIRHQLSISGSDDDAPVSETLEEDEADADADLTTTATQQRPTEPHVDIQSDIVMQDIGDSTDDLLDTRTDTLNLANPEDDPSETFNIPHRTSTDGSTTGPPTLPPHQPPHQASPPTNLNVPPPPWRAPTANILSALGQPAHTSAAMPRDEDVLMSLQLLAYVSKYCNLRSYFQSSHLVPRLKIGADLHASDPDYNPADAPTQEQLDEDWDNEFVTTPTTKPYNIFPLIEKFTASKSSHRHSSSHPPQPPASPSQTDMSYWAGVVMRNLCRKDDSRGGIRQCAFWQCGKWEEYTRQFAKCRRCRRTKYCSKECQKGAWGSHRFWCVAAEEGRGEDGEAAHGSSRSHRHRHHHGHHHSHAAHGTGSAVGGG